nr:HAD-IA family hydrolase [bacterium]
MPLYPDAVSLLEQGLQKGYRHYILSNNFPELAHIIDALGIRPYFSGITVSGLVGYDKPRPEIFRAALRQAGHPHVALMIGDNPIADMRGSREAGMVPVLVHHSQPCPDAQYAFDTLSPIAGLL